MRVTRLKILLAVVALSVGGQVSFAMGQDDTAPLDITLAAIWEGESLSPTNEEAFAKFRQNFTAAKIVHFISPVYLTRAVRNSRVRDNERQKILEFIGKGDLAGIYLNGWKSITESAGVSFRNNPTFWGNSLSVRQCLDDCGREVALTAYPQDELRKIIKKSRTLFAKNGFGSPTIMQVAGHAAGPEVLAAAVAEGITHDFSAVAPDLLSPRLYRYPLRQQLLALWAGVGPLMPPIELKTASGPLVQMTANGIHTELMNETEILSRLEAVMGSAENGPPKAGATRHLFIGFPMETLAISLPKLEFALQEIFKRSSETKTPLRWTAENLSKASANAH